MCIRDRYNVMGCGSPVIYINNKKVRDMTELDRIRANEILSAEVTVSYTHLDVYKRQPESEKPACHAQSPF